MKDVLTSALAVIKTTFYIIAMRTLPDRWLVNTLSHPVGDFRFCVYVNPQELQNYLTLKYIFCSTNWKTQFIQLVCFTHFFTLKSQGLMTKCYALNLQRINVQWFFWNMDLSMVKLESFTLGLILPSSCVKVKCTHIHRSYIYVFIYIYIWYVIYMIHTHTKYKSCEKRPVLSAFHQ